MKGLIFVMSLLCCTTNQARLTVSFSKIQLFEGESVTVSCEVDEENSSAGWTLSRKQLEIEAECKLPAASCYIHYISLWDSGVYWCESRNGSTSNNITLNVLPKKPSPPPSPTSDSSPSPSSPSKWGRMSWSFVLLICAGVILVILVLLVLVVLVVRRHFQSKPKAYEVKADDVDNSDFSITDLHHHGHGPMRQNNETDPAVFYSTVRKDDLSYAQVELNPKSHREIPPDLEVVYSTPRCTQFPLPPPVHNQSP